MRGLLSRVTRATTGRAMSEQEPWYAAGLCFGCQRSGNCCTVEGYVWVDARRARAIARHLGLDVEEFSKRYLRRVGRSHSLIERPDHECIFWRDGCQIYPVRPTQCRTWPFWPENLRSPEAWREAVHDCPGAQEGGRHYGREEIERLVRGRGAASDEEGSGT